MSIEPEALKTLRLESGAGDWFIKVRPYRRHRAYELLLSDVAQLVAERVIKAEAREKLKARRAARAGR